MLDLIAYLSDEMYFQQLGALERKIAGINELLALAPEIVRVMPDFPLIRVRDGYIEQRLVLEQNQNISLKLLELLEGNTEAYLKLIEYHCPPGTMHFKRHTELTRIRDLPEHYQTGWRYVDRSSRYLVGAGGPLSEIAPTPPILTARIGRWGWTEKSSGIVRRYWTAYAPEINTLFYEYRTHRKEW